MTYKETIQNLLSGWDGRLAVHYVCYNGNGQVHRELPYGANAASLAVLEKQLELYQDEIGADILIATWQGPWSGSCDTVAQAMSALCTKFGMEFALLLDPGGMQKWQANLTEAQITTNVVEALTTPSTVAMLNSSSYVPEKYILDFTTGANLTELGEQFPNYKFLAQDQGFAWINISANITDSVAKNAWAVANLKSQNSNPAMKIPAICYSFDDSGQPLPVGVATQTAFDAAGGVRNWANSVWGGPARVLESFGGMFAIQQLGVTPVNAGIIAITTVNDYDERSSGPLEKVISERAGVNWSTI